MALAQLNRDLATHQVAPQDKLEVAIKTNLLTSPSFGKWNALILEIMKVYRGLKEQLVIPELFDFCFQESGKEKLPVRPIQTEVIGPLIQLRNDFHPVF